MSTNDEPQQDLNGFEEDRILQPYENPELHLNISELEEYVRKQHISVNKLDEKVAELPKVDENGYSECPYALKMYKSKDFHLKAMISDLKMIRENILPKIIAESARHRKNMEMIYQAYTQLKRAEPADHLKSAEDKEKWMIDILEGLRKQVMVLISRMEKTIEIAKAKNMDSADDEKENGETKKNQDDQEEMMDQMDISFINHLLYGNHEKLNQPINMPQPNPDLITPPPILVLGNPDSQFTFAPPIPSVLPACPFVINPSLNILPPPSQNMPNTASTGPLYEGKDKCIKSNNKSKEE